MAIFKREEPQQSNNGNGKPPERRSTWQAMLDHLNAAEHHLQQFQHLLSTIGFDFQKPLDYIAMRRDSLIKAIEEAGGTIEQPQGSIEEQIREFIPKNYRPPVDDNAQP